MSKFIRKTKDTKLDLSNRVDVKAKKVTTDFGIKFGEDEYCIKDVTFDFSNCDDADILSRATSNCVIKLQTNLKRLFATDEAKAKQDLTNVDVKSRIVATARVKLTDMQKATKLAATMSDEEKRQLIATLEAEMKKAKNQR